MTEQAAGRRRLLAGSVGPERRPARPDAREARWFEPMHVRDVKAARERLAVQVAAGADVVVAPTWLTHRRALIAVGESRRARAWTAAALRVGREAIEVGLERRVEREPGPDVEGDAEDAELPQGPAMARPKPLLAASLPALDEVPEPGMGRLLPRQAASERDYRDQAGLLADAAPDVLLVEGQATSAEVRIAAEAAIETGLPVWVALSGASPGSAGAGSDDERLRFVDALGGLALQCLLLPGLPRAELLDRPLDWGGLIDDEPSTAAAWLEAGAVVLGSLDGATAGRLAGLREAIDRSEAAALESYRTADDAWWAHVQRAASMAGRGRAIWLHDPDAGPAPRELLPAGFTWVVIDRDEAGAIPDDHVRLLVDASGWPEAAHQWGPKLERGGVLASRGAPRVGASSRLRIVVIDDALDPPLVLLRQEG